MYIDGKKNTKMKTIRLHSGVRPRTRSWCHHGHLTLSFSSSTTNARSRRSVSNPTRTNAPETCGGLDDEDVEDEDGEGDEDEAVEAEEDDECCCESSMPRGRWDCERAPSAFDIRTSDEAVAEAEADDVDADEDVAAGRCGPDECDWRGGELRTLDCEEATCACEEADRGEREV